MADDEMVTQTRIVWEAMEDVPAVHANQFLSQVGLSSGEPPVPDGIYLAIGYINPPILLGAPTDDEYRRKADAVATDGLAVAPIARVLLSRARAQELFEVLQTTLAKYDAAVERGRENMQERDSV